MVQGSGSLRLVDEQFARDPGAVGAVNMGTYLDGDGAVDERVVAHVHVAHGAASRDIQDFILSNFFRPRRFRFGGVHLRVQPQESQLDRA